MVYVLFNVRENDIFVICIKRYNLFLQFFRKNVVLFICSLIYIIIIKMEEEKIFFNNMVINWDIVY